MCAVSRKEFMKYLTLGPLGAWSIPKLMQFKQSDKKNIKAKTDSSFQRAKQHPIKYDKPAVDFFEGALLGNGAMGVVVNTRPDAIELHFGHNSVWDIRIAENHKDKIGTFNYVFKKVKKIPASLSKLSQDPWYKNYTQIARDNYSKPYPRPFPCGTLLLGFDRREVELIGHQLDISNGVCEVNLLTKDKQKLRLQLYTDMTKDKLWMRLVNKQNALSKNIFDRIRLIPDPSTPDVFPKYEVEENLSKGYLAFRQRLPAQEPETPKDKYSSAYPDDKAFRLGVSLNSSLKKKPIYGYSGRREKMPALEAGFSDNNEFIACAKLDEGMAKKVDKNTSSISKPNNKKYNKSLKKNNGIWKDYWNKSGVNLDDNFLEEIWYRNLYFLNCSVKKGVTSPGLFANWSFKEIGTSWHGDYHMNYNIEQPFWVSFSSNHLEKNLVYVSLIEFLMDESQAWAQDYYNLPGANFPHSSYPVKMTMNPYPVPDWGWEIFETPWAVQGLWWQYLYSNDKEYLEKRAYFPIKQAVKFLVAYMKRPEAHGGRRWNDNKYHIFPTVPPELYGLQPGFKHNYDTIIGLTLTKFIFNAFRQATEILGYKNKEKNLLSDIADILGHFPDYPTTKSENYGKIFVSVPGENDKVVYNVPLPLATVFPGEDHGLDTKDSNKKVFNILKNSFEHRQNEGGNDLVFKNLQAARIGMLDLDKFKRQIKYCLLPNGTAADMAMQAGGRYGDLTDFGFMDDMGIWFENFALPVVINESLMQSYDGTIRLFPNWPLEKDAEFHTLRAAGAFLVSASLENKKVHWIKIKSETGSKLKIILPWEKGLMETNNKKSNISSKKVEMETKKGQQLLFYPPKTST